MSCLRWWWLEHLTSARDESWRAQTGSRESEGRQFPWYRINLSPRPLYHLYMRRKCQSLSWDSGGKGLLCSNKWNMDMIMDQGLNAWYEDWKPLHMTTIISIYGHVVIGNLQHQFPKLTSSDSNCHGSWLGHDVPSLLARNAGSVLQCCDSGYNCLASWHLIRAHQSWPAPVCSDFSRLGQCQWHTEAGPGSGEKIL